MKWLLIIVLYTPPTSHVGPIALKANWHQQLEIITVETEKKCERLGEQIVEKLKLTLHRDDGGDTQFICIQSEV